MVPLQFAFQFYGHRAGDMSSSSYKIMYQWLRASSISLEKVHLVLPFLSYWFGSPHSQEEVEFFGGNIISSLCDSVSSLTGFVFAASFSSFAIPG